MSQIQEIFVDDNLSDRRKTIADICAKSPMFDVVTRKVSKRTLEDEKGHYLADFATQSYLGFDFDPRVIEAAVQGTRDFGTVIAWCRLVSTVTLLTEAERKTAELVGSEACSIFASTTLLNHGVIPALAGKDGVIFLDKSAHATMYEGAKIARDSGATLVSFPTGDFEALEKLLVEYQQVKKKLILTDGVYSMTGEYADLPSFDALAKKYDALVFVDDAHGFGVVGENPSPEHPYGHKGNGLIKHFGLSYDNMVYIGCFSKAYGTFGAFIACDQKLRDFLISQATPHDLGGAGPASALAALLAGYQINKTEGQARRRQMYDLTKKAVDGLEELGYTLETPSDFPILSVLLGKSDDIIAISKLLYENHILLTLAPYPMVKRGKESLRITITATNTEEEIDQLLVAFKKLKSFLIEKGYPFKDLVEQ
ncbi:aminotransferase class I/II-fold pyridoxal phosphate-dependent enzyme [Candidatus Neptunochlamydia vexilliferae]|uniref:8-amino-7-oxononanoate synthase n=1 Tax=Candidatus Neptunichlamydia vexilliferae TaxID=1651774 RepID=A0ABS0AXY2_9BACT|nr:pyridoxal phosphate-dependent aminotransferase family protein [Candidatus Neptunochlamydia vexilliferae]MBF5058998.1 8-amino-7-oxononanoate synthase [Candidatus Neptunochlamydia vexilliferae]